MILTPGADGWFIWGKGFTPAAKDVINYEITWQTLSSTGGEAARKRGEHGIHYPGLNGVHRHHYLES